MLIDVYVYEKLSGKFLYKDTGDPEFIIEDLSNDKDFTLTPPPDNTKSWRWVDNQWQ